MPRRKHSTTESRQESSSSITLQLSPSGIVGIAVVLFCLFLWMFLLGIWAGQTILYPPQPQTSASVPVPLLSSPPPARKQIRATEAMFPEAPPVELLQPAEKKKRIAPPELRSVTKSQ